MTEILRIAAPLTVWIAAFSAVYGLQGIVCSDWWSSAGLNPGQARATLIAASVAAIALQAALLGVLRRPRFGSSLPWVRRVSTILGGVALVATVWSLLPVVSTSLCL